MKFKKGDEVKFHPESEVRNYDCKVISSIPSDLIKHGYTRLRKNYRAFIAAILTMSSGELFLLVEFECSNKSNNTTRLPYREYQLVKTIWRASDAND